MSTKTFIASAAPKGSDHMVEAWLAFAAAPLLKENLNNLAELLEAEVRRRIPHNSQEDLLGIRDEIIQKTCLRLLGGHLSGNPKLLLATRSGSVAVISYQLRVCISTALKYERKEAIRRAVRHNARQTELTEDNGGVSLHPAGRSFWELPYEVQRELALAALRLAVTQRLLTASNAAMAIRMIEGNLTEAEVSREMGISRQAVNQRMEKVRKHLPKMIDTQEFPL